MACSCKSAGDWVQCADMDAIADGAGAFEREGGFVVAIGAGSSKNQDAGRSHAGWNLVKAFVGSGTPLRSTWMEKITHRGGVV